MESTLSRLSESNRSRSILHSQWTNKVSNKLHDLIHGHSQWQFWAADVAESTFNMGLPLSVIGCLALSIHKR